MSHRLAGSVDRAQSRFLTRGSRGFSLGQAVLLCYALTFSTLILRTVPSLWRRAEMWTVPSPQGMHRLSNCFLSRCNLRRPEQYVGPQRSALMGAISGQAVALGKDQRRFVHIPRGHNDCCTGVLSDPEGPAKDPAAMHQAQCPAPAEAKPGRSGRRQLRQLVRG